MYLRYGLPRALRYLWKNRGAAGNSILIVAASLAMSGVIALLYLNVMHLSENWLSNTAVSLFLEPKIDQAGREKLLEKVTAHPMVREAKLVSPDEGLKALAKKLGSGGDFLNATQSNGLPYTIDFDVFVDYRRRIDSIAKQFSAMKGVDDVVYAQRVLDKVALFFRMSRWVGMFFIGLALLSFFLVIANAARLSLHSRSQEIEILHLAGATRGFIRSAFVVQGILIAIAGWLFALAIIWFSYRLIVAGLTWNEFTMPLKETTIFFPWRAVAASLLIIVLLGGFSSRLAVNHLLKKMEP